MVVRDDVDVGVRGGGVERADPLGPRLELVRRVQVVVPRVAPRTLAEPVLPVAAVDPHVGDGRGDRRAGSERPVEERLIDVHETYRRLGELREDVRRVPRVVAHLEHERQPGERPEQPAQPLLVRVGPLEGPRELEERRAELPRAVERVERRARLLDLLRPVRLVALVGEPAPHLRAEPELRHVRDALQPACGDRRGERPVERRVHLDGAEVAGEEPEPIEPARLGLGVDDPSPVHILPPRRPEADHALPDNAGRGIAAKFKRGSGSRPMTVKLTASTSGLGAEPEPPHGLRGDQ